MILWHLFVINFKLHCVAKMLNFRLNYRPICINIFYAVVDKMLPPEGAAEPRALWILTVGKTKVGSRITSISSSGDSEKGRL